MMRFVRFVNQEHQLNLTDYAGLYQWSIENSALFWKSLWDFFAVIATEQPTAILTPANKMQNTQWFAGTKLNFAENLLRRCDDKLAMIYTSEKGDQQQLTYQELHTQVAKIAAYLIDQGIQKGDRIAAFMPNLPETIIAMLAATSLGAIWSSCSSDFGLQGLMDRFEQIKPSILFAVDGHFYHGKKFYHLDKIEELQQQLPSLKKTIITPHLNKKPNIEKLKNSLFFQDIIKSYKTKPKLNFTPLPFDHPLYILYSSGTTGKPKCIVHGAGGTLLQHLKEHRLHTNLTAEKRFFFFTTCGWMMWNWLVSGLATGTTLILYEGSPFYPNPTHLFDLIDNLNIHIFGAGAKFFEASAKENLIPKQTHSLQSLETILTTGSPLLPDSFDYIYQQVKSNLCLSSISGGTDIISCFALGNPTLPVYRGELQSLGLGMSVEVWNDQGEKITDEKGELVCTQAFPSMPIYFWNDKNGQRYQKAYFERFQNIWTHGDYAMLTKHQGLIIFGRSDTTLNPGGIRIGTAEIYNQVEKVPEVIDCLAVTQRWQGNERIILFVVLAENISLINEKIQEIKNIIKSNTSPHHVPAKIIQVADLPRTLSGKLAELAVKKIIHNEPVKNKEALANPASLQYFVDLDELNH